MGESKGFERMRPIVVFPVPEGGRTPGPPLQDALARRRSDQDVDVPPGNRGIALLLKVSLSTNAVCTVGQRLRLGFSIGSHVVTERERPIAAL
jgi:hypothetical protein